MYLFTPAMVETEKRLKAMHPEPEWEHLFSDHYEQRDWVAENTPKWLELYNFYPVDRQREQVFRWLVVWKLGGFWLDTQLRGLTSLDPLRTQPLVLAELKRMEAAEFEALHRMPIPEGMPAAGWIRLTDGGFAAGPGHWFIEKVLEVLIERAGYLDTNAEPTPEDEEYTTGEGVLNGAWLRCLADGLPVYEALLAAPQETSPARPMATESERAAEPSGLGGFAYRHPDLND